MVVGNAHHHFTIKSIRTRTGLRHTATCECCGANYIHWPDGARSLLAPEGVNLLDLVMAVETHDLEGAFDEM